MPKPNWRDLALLAGITLAGLALRLAVWRWREFQPLGGDEQEYLQQALTLLREHQYVELRLMRPPLYTLFLAASILAVDSLVQQLRLVQALISAATVPLVYLLTQEVAGQGKWRSPQRAALLAAALCALNYTLAANATELLTETLFMLGLTTTLWLLLRASRSATWPLASLAGLAAGALCLVRSVGLPLLPLGAVWLLFKPQGTSHNLKAKSLPFLCAALLVILPWTARNALIYGGLIIIDTTGAENLWLDNDPAGREAVKAQLYALGEDRLLRQQVASRQGVAVLLADPGRFMAKAWGESLKLFALEQSDDLRARRAIWVAPAELWTRLILGDALWLMLLLVGSYGLAQSAFVPHSLAASDHKRNDHRRRAIGSRLLIMARSPAWLLAPWALYVLLTTLLFHVELRYRLPLYPALLPYTALVLVGGASHIGWRARLATVAPLLGLSLTLLHAPYPALAWQLGWKHWHLAQAEAALRTGELALAQGEAAAALTLDPASALAQVALARAALITGDQQGALALLDAAIAAVPDHPQAHVLRGAVRRALGDLAGARADLAYESASRQDLQRWLWAYPAMPAPARLALGDGLDLGFVAGVHAVREGETGLRWTTAQADLRLTPPAGAHELVLRLASGQPTGTPPVPVAVWLDGEPLGTVAATVGWAEVTVPLPTPTTGGDLVVTLRVPTFTPRQFERASPDGRILGVQVAWVAAR
ncbi:MAG: glycosyltransferase family 39 protein [Chloroflexales bacterium]